MLFTLSLGAGIMITYASYVEDAENLVVDTPTRHLADVRSPTFGDVGVVLEVAVGVPSFVSVLAGTSPPRQPARPKRPVSATWRVCRPETIRRSS